MEFALVLCDKKDQEVLYRYPLDTEEAFERFSCAAFFEMARTGKTDPHQTWTTQVLPGGGKDGVPPSTNEFVVEVLAEKECITRRTFGVEVFQQLVETKIGPELVRREWLNSGEVFTYYLESSSTEGAALEPRSLLLPTLVDRPAKVGKAAKGLPIRIAPSVLAEIMALSRPSEVETGGALVGQLCRSEGNMFLEITEQLPAHYAIATKASLQFTAQTLFALVDQITARGPEFTLAGWWHSHPFPHKEANKKKTRSPNLFFSQDDLWVMEQHFSWPWQIAVVVDPKAQKEQHPFALFGWVNGQCVPIRFYRSRP